MEKTLRDEFAMAALTALIMRAQGKVLSKEIVRDAFYFADDAMKARNGK